MDSIPSTVKEFRFAPESQIVTIVFGDDRTEDFIGEENYKPAHHAAIKSADFSVATPDLSLTSQDGKTVVVNVPADVPHETFDL